MCKLLHAGISCFLLLTRQLLLVLIKLAPAFFHQQRTGLLGF
jgi:hypothetical protein